MSPARAAAGLARGALVGASALAVLVAHAQPDLAALAREVADTERAFAKTMADRDHAAFTRFLSEQAVFIPGAKALHGKAAVAAAWQRFFESKEAPFSWEPDQVEVLADGSLAHSSGPVRDPAGRPVARFNSVWRLEAPGTWRIVFDKGQPWEAAPER